MEQDSADRCIITEVEFTNIARKNRLDELDSIIVCTEVINNMLDIYEKKNGNPSCTQAIRNTVARWITNGE